ncbi:hypothetical protein L2E82_01640 [Cichorium intybus]|uniref:Uncharacterized protein n=1 Tax=Cichorium intybus TaxID=13427 RepID=A0ACB9H0Q5_CICIN|nr:hypothetical protein L2E82_01640 [Cichorium intybus]
MKSTQENQEDEDEDDDDDNEDEEDTEETYTLRFEGETNPLVLTEVDALGVQPYERLKTLENEYEALAAKKGKANRNNNHEGMPPEKKPRQEDFHGANFEKLLAEMTYGMRRRRQEDFSGFPFQIKKKGRRRGSKKKISPEITRKLGDATLYYTHGQYEEAIPLLKGIVRICSKWLDPYQTLGLIYDALGNKLKAVGFYMLVVHLAPKDASLRKLLFTWSLELGNDGQAIHCLDRAIRADPEDMSLRYHHASLFVEIGEHLKAAESYEKIWQLRPKNFEALKTAAMLYQKCSQHERIVSNLEDYLKKNPKDADLNVSYSGGKDLPVEMLVQAGIFHAHLGNMEKAEPFFSVFTHVAVNDYSRLIIEAADSLVSLKHHGSALKYYLMLEGNDGVNKVLLYLKIRRCIDARLEVVSVLLEADKDDEAISVLSPPSDSESRISETSDGKKTLVEGYRPVASSSDLSKANQAKRSLQKQEERRAAALAAGVAWQSDESDDDSPVYREPLLPNLLKDEKLLMLIIDVTEKQEERQSLGAQAKDLATIIITPFTSNNQIGKPPLVTSNTKSKSYLKSKFKDSATTNSASYSSVAGGKYMRKFCLILNLFSFNSFPIESIPKLTITVSKTSGFGLALAPSVKP